MWDVIFHATNYQYYNTKTEQNFICQESAFNMHLMCYL